MKIICRFRKSQLRNGRTVQCPSGENYFLKISNCSIRWLIFIEITQFLNNPLRREKGNGRWKPLYEKAFPPHIHLKNQLKGKDLNSQKISEDCRLEESKIILKLLQSRVLFNLTPLTNSKYRLIWILNWNSSCNRRSGQNNQWVIIKKVPLLRFCRSWDKKNNLFPIRHKDSNQQTSFKSVLEHSRSPVSFLEVHSHDLEWHTALIWRQDSCLEPKKLPLKCGKWMKNAMALSDGMKLFSFEK